jgi:hypothetical protein
VPDFTNGEIREIARRYWAIKNAGTVEDLCREFDISKPTLLKYADMCRPPRTKKPASDKTGSTDTGRVTP